MKKVSANQDKKYERINVIPVLYTEKRPGWTK